MTNFVSAKEQIKKMNNTQREHNKIKNRNHEKANLFNGQISERKGGGDWTQKTPAKWKYNRINNDKNGNISSPCVCEICDGRYRTKWGFWLDTVARAHTFTKKHICYFTNATQIDVTAFEITGFAVLLRLRDRMNGWMNESVNVDRAKQNRKKFCFTSISVLFFFSVVGFIFEK